MLKNMYSHSMKIVCGVLLSTLLVACGGDKTASEGGAADPQKQYKWKMVTSWPKNFPGLGRAPKLSPSMLKKCLMGV